MILLDFTGVCFDAIMHPDHVTSKKTETSVTESPGKKGILGGKVFAQISFFIKIHYYLRCTSWLHKRLSITACGYCFIFVEYCSNKEMLYKIQRGE